MAYKVGDWSIPLGLFELASHKNDIWMTVGHIQMVACALRACRFRVIRCALKFEFELNAFKYNPIFAPT